MQYRKFGKLDWKVSALSFGAMRLPVNNWENNGENINEKEAIDMMRFAADNGVNYFDTAYPYHNGKSEVVVGKALKGGYRAKVKVATKMPTWLIKSHDDFDRLLNEQLKRLDMEHIDFYLLHGLGKWSWENVILKNNIILKAEAAVKDGRIGHIGFSFHDNYDAFKMIIDGYGKWEFCQIQYNYMDTEKQAEKRGLQYAALKGIPVVVMEPLLGGRLSKPPDNVKKVFEASDKKRTASEWALQWVWNHPEVTTILSGMSSMKQVQENIASANNAAANSFLPEELKTIGMARMKFEERQPIPCTKCNYCLPCPNNVNIPRNFEIYNDGMVYNDMNGAKIVYARFFGNGGKADLCTQCKECEEKCPQKIEISKLISEVKIALA